MMSLAQTALIVIQYKYSYDHSGTHNVGAKQFPALGRVTVKHKSRIIKQGANIQLKTR